MQNLIILFMYSVASGIMYRLGGVGLKIPMDEKFRDWGCPLFAFLTMWALGINAEFWWSLIAFFAMWFTLVTYWEHWKSEEVEWFEWAITGFFYGLALLPIALYTGKYLGFIIRTIILISFMPFSNKFQFKVIWDGADCVEFLRGFVYNVTIPLLLL